MRIPDWVIYTLVLIVVVSALFVRGSDIQLPGAPKTEIVEAGPEGDSSGRGPSLPEPQPFDEKVLVQVGDVTDGLGTAFAVNNSGAWLTARHVVDGCSVVGLEIGDGRFLRAEEVRTSPENDLALIITQRAPNTVPMDIAPALHIGDSGYHFGFPQGRSGEVISRLAARSRLVTRGRYSLDEPVLAWVEQGRTEGIEGTLAGLSGGPVFNASGDVIGVTLAESPRRGRIYTSAPDSIANFLESEGENILPTDGHAISAASYHGEADRLRKTQAVLKVVCMAQAL